MNKIRKVILVLLFIPLFFSCKETSNEEEISNLLFDAVKKNENIQRVSEIISEKPELVYEIDKYGYDIINIAINNCEEPYIEELVEILPNDFFNKKDNSGLLPISKVVYSCESKTLLEKVIDKTININEKDIELRTALSYAAEYGNKDYIKLLLLNGADGVINDFDSRGITPLFYAAKSNTEDIYNLLESKGAINKTSPKGQTVAMMAVSNPNIDFVYNIFSKIDVNLQDENGKTALMYACLENKKDIVKLLLNKGADVNVLDEYGKSALMYACAECSDITIISKIISKKGSLFKVKDLNGRNAFYYFWKNTNLFKYKILIILIILIIVCIITRPISIFRYYVLNEPITRPPIWDIWTKDN